MEQSLDTHTLSTFNKPLEQSQYNNEVKIEIKSTKPLTGKQNLLIIPICKFFKEQRNLYILINIIYGRSIISLRLIEYFVVNYVLENNTYYNMNKYKNNPEFIIERLFTPLTADIPPPAPGQATATGPAINIKAEMQQSIQQTLNQENFDNYFLVHDNYKCQLKEYNKKNFDPFCRWIRIRMYYDPSNPTLYFYTTVAQLNFFKWAIENYVLDYILDNLPMIEKSMNDYEKAIKKEKKLRKLNQMCSLPQPPLPQTNEPIAIVSPALNNILTLDFSTSTDKLADKKTKIKGRTKKEFTKTNRSILKYECTKIVNFD